MREIVGIAWYGDHPKEAIRGFTGRIDPSSEEELIALTIIGTTATKRHVPQARDRDRRPVRVPQWAEEGARRRVEGVDVAGSLHVADQHVVTEIPEIGRSLDDAPGGHKWTCPAGVGSEVIRGQ